MDIPAESSAKSASSGSPTGVQTTIRDVTFAMGTGPMRGAEIAHRGLVRVNPVLEIAGSAATNSPPFFAAYRENRASSAVTATSKCAIYCRMSLPIAGRKSGLRFSYVFAYAQIGSTIRKGADVCNFAQ
jgi:hypothetical protein